MEIHPGNPQDSDGNRRPFGPEALNRFPAMDLRTLDSTPLFSRFDSKFLCPINRLDDLLGLLPDNFAILENAGSRVTRYQSNYLDTPDFQLYKMHLFDRARRLKVRWRTYGTDPRAFLEVKQRTPRGETKKFRLKEQMLPESLHHRHLEFLDRFTHLGPALTPSLTVHYQRITLLAASLGVKWTLDFSLHMQGTQDSVSFPGAAIIEIKHRTRTPAFEMRELLRKFHLRQMPISKYALGVASLLKVPYNSFLWTRLQMEKFEHDLARI